MKTALLIGCGSKFGLTLLESLLQQGWQVFSISGSALPAHDNLTQLTVDWHTVSVANMEKYLKSLPDIDLVFCNQNASALAAHNFGVDSYSTVELWKQEKTWAQSYFVSCILPFHIIHTLGSRCTASTKIGWMLSGYVCNHSDVSNADYIGNKYQNYVLMKAFSEHHPSCFFGVNPDDLNSNQDREQLLQLLTDDACNFRSNVVKFNGNIDKRFEIFNT
jgi:hypothetical protein